jgi:hypothetical protein
MPATNIKITATDKTKGAFSSVRRSVAGLSSSVMSLQGALGGIGLALGVRAFVNFTKSSLALADGIGKMSDRLGITTTALQTFRFAGEQAGETFESMDNNLVKFVRNLGDGQKGIKTITDEFDRLNIDLEDQNGNWKDHETILKEVADRYKTMKDPADKLSSAMTLFGRGGRVMVNMLSAGSDGLERLRGELVSSGGIIRESLIRDSEDANDAVNKLSHTINTTFMHALSDMAPAIETAANGLQAFMIPAKELEGTGERFFSSEHFSKALIGMAYGFEVVRIAATTTFGLIKLQIKSVISQVEFFANIIIAVLGGAFLHVRNLVLPLINTIIKGINHIKSALGGEPIKLLEEKEVSIMLDLGKATAKAREEVIGFKKAREELLIQSEKQRDLAKETLEIRAASFLKAQVQLPPTGMLEQLGETADPIEKDTEVTDAKIENVIRYQSVFTEAFADMANSVIALSDEEKKANALRIDAALSTSQTMIHSMKGFNKSWFEASKALSIAESIMSTYKAATAALAIQPPPVGIAFAATITTLGLANVARIKSQKFEGKAEGGSVRAGQSYIVGERGMEMFTPNQSGNITPNNALGGTTNINFNIRTNDARGFDQLLAERRGMIVSMINRSLNEQGRRSFI